MQLIMVCNRLVTSKYVNIFTFVTFGTVGDVAEPEQTKHIYMT